MSELYIGFMSGTSLDGVDASLVRTDGVLDFEILGNMHLTYPEEFREQIKELFLHSGSFLEIEKQLTEFHIELTFKLLKQAGLVARDIKALGFHGQSILHKPEVGCTWQIGNPHLLAQKTGINVVHDFRRRDLALGGQGAPLVPIFHKLLMHDQEYPAIVVNIGGVSNLTYISKKELIAFDTGLGNALIDDSMVKYFGLPFDNNGQVASEGRVDELIINKVLASEYFNRPYPKSLDRNAYKFLADLLADHSPVDIVSTLTYVTSATIAHSIAKLPEIPKKLFICGGGVRNRQMMLWLEEILLNQGISCGVENIAKISKLDPDYIEAQAFAYLAARFFKKLPSTFPTTTGATVPSVCGCLVEVGNYY